MSEIFDNYLSNAFDDEKQAGFKITQFEFNYRRFFPQDKSSSILDIGIGRGEMLTCAKKWGYSHYLGLDISPSIVNFCSKLDLNCELTDNTTNWLKQNENSFDLITLLDVLEHVPKSETIEFLKALYNSLKPNGVIIIQTPNLQAVDGQLHRYNDFTHEFGYIEHSLKQVLVTAGFAKMSFHGFEYLTGNPLKISIAKFIRNILWGYVKMKRRFTGNLNPEILHPVFYSVVYK